MYESFEGKRVRVVHEDGTNIYGTLVNANESDTYLVLGAIGSSYRILLSKISSVVLAEIDEKDEDLEGDKHPDYVDLNVGKSRK